jgi:hypothetical protein
MAKGKKEQISGKIDTGKRVRELARERVGTVPPPKLITPRGQKPPRHKKSVQDLLRTDET